MWFIQGFLIVFPEFMFGTFWDWFQTPINWSGNLFNVYIMLTKWRSEFRSVFKEDPFLRDYAVGLVIGASGGISAASSEFLPSICNSLRGAGNLLWATINHPIESSKLFASAVLEFHKFLLSCDKAELVEILVPEIYELVTQWNYLSPKKRGELTGYVLGKYGTDILLPIAAIKGIKYIKTYSEIKKIEKFCTLKTLNNSPESRLALQQAATTWNAQRLAWFERIEIEIDQQTKHIPNKWNYQEGKRVVLNM